VKIYTHDGTGLKEVGGSALCPPFVARRSREMDPALKTKLNTLKNYLSNLPDTLPPPKTGLATYNFRLIDISAEKIEDYGEVGAINRQLEISFGSRRDGPIIFTERGPELVGVIEVLNTYLQKEPTSAILQKWVDDLTISAELSFATNGVPISASVIYSLHLIVKFAASIHCEGCPARNGIRLSQKGHTSCSETQ
jgi:hypothetical protein